jgi:hypothetical protein
MVIKNIRQWSRAKTSRVQSFKNIEFLGFVSDAERARLMSEARSIVVMA